MAKKGRKDDIAEVIPESPPAPPKKHPEHRKAITRVATTGGRMADLSRQQAKDGTVRFFGMVKINDWTFVPNKPKVVLTTPEILDAVKKGILEGLTYVSDDIEVAES